MQMWGNDLNPVAWFVVKNELADVSRDEVESLLDAIAARVKPQIMPFYATDCPRGHKGTWIRIADEHEMGDGFDSLTLAPRREGALSLRGTRSDLHLWAKHGAVSGRRLRPSHADHDLAGDRREGNHDRGVVAS